MSWLVWCRTWRMSSWIRATVLGAVQLLGLRVFVVNWCATGLEPGMPLKHLRTTQALVPEGLLNHCEGLRTTLPKTAQSLMHTHCSFLWSIMKIATAHVDNSKQTRVKTARVHPARCNLAHWLTRHGSPTIYRCFVLPQLLYRWRHQSRKFWIPPRIHVNVR